MFDFLKKESKYRLLRPIDAKSKSILEEERFRYPEYDKEEEAQTDSYKVNYLRKPIAKRSKMAILLASISVLFTWIAYNMVIAQRGLPSLTVSAMAFSSMLFAVTGLIYGILSFKEKDVKYMVSYIALGVAGSDLVLWLMIIFIGYRGR